jgi:hypothetical protein
VKGFALDELHHQVVGPDVVEMADIGVVQRGKRAGLAREAIGERFIRHFQGDVAAEARIVRLEHLSHTAPAKARAYVIWTDRIVGRDHQRGFYAIGNLSDPSVPARISAEKSSSSQRIDRLSSSLASTVANTGERTKAEENRTIQAEARTSRRQNDDVPPTQWAGPELWGQPFLSAVIGRT